MAQKKYDGIIEGARYTPEGKLSGVRIYERRGPTYSDRTLLTRAELLQRLRAKKKFAVGMRQAFLGSTFTIVADVRLAGSRGQEAIVAGGSSAVDRDDLAGAPVF